MRQVAKSSHLRGLMVRDAPKGALLTMRFWHLRGACTPTMNTPRGVFMERGESVAADSILVLRSAPQARVSKDGRKRREGRT